MAPVDKTLKLAGPVVVLVLTMSAIASVWLLVGRASSSRLAQLEVSSLRFSQADLRFAPFNADPPAGVELFAATRGAEQLYAASTLGAEQLYADCAPSAGGAPSDTPTGRSPTTSTAIGRADLGMVLLGSDGKKGNPVC
jgi:hypothetical protein